MTCQQLLNLIPQLLVDWPDLVQESPDFYQPGNHWVLLNRLTLCLEQQVEKEMDAILQQQQVLGFQVRHSFLSS